MLKILNCKSKNFSKQLVIFLNRRRPIKQADTKIVNQILKDVKKNKIKAVLKYEKIEKKLKRLGVDMKRVS